MHPADEPPRPTGWRRAFRLPLSRRQAARELNDEVEFHLQMREEKLRRAGHSPEAARRLARDRFGDVDEVQAACERVDRPRLLAERTGSLLSDLRQDLLVASRGLRRAPAFTFATIATLALGIGAATAIFSLTYGVLLRPLPFAAPEELVRVGTADSDPTVGDYLSAPEYLELHGAAPSLRALGAFHDAETTLTGTGQPQRLRAAVTTPSLFRLLGVQAVHGRLFVEEDAAPGADATVVLSHSLWRQQFGSDPRVIGTPARLAGRERTIIGVMPPGVTLDEHEVYVPMLLDPQNLRPRGAHYLQVVARLRDRGALTRARAELAAYASGAVADHPESYPDPAFSLTATPLREAWVGATRPTLLVLSGAVGLLLLLACANVAALLLVRSESRQREVAVRIALGAGRGRLARQLLSETLLLASAGAIVGFPLAMLAVRGLLALHADVVPAGVSVEIDTAVLLVAAAVLGAVVLLAGLVPALQVGALDVRSAISTGAAGGGRRGGRLRGGLVLAEIAIATVVLVGGGLVGRSFWQLQKVNPGFVPERVLTFDVTLPQSRYQEEAEVPLAYERLLGELRALPEVRYAAAVSHLPMSGRLGNWTVEVEGRERRAGEAEISPNYTIATPDYFRTMGIAVVAGRAFEPHDGAGSTPVVLVSESLARYFWAGEDPLGRRIRLGGPPGIVNAWMEVVGVVGDVRGEGLAAVSRPTYYMLDSQFPVMIGVAIRSMTVVMRGADERALNPPAIRGVVTSFDPEIAAANLRPLSSVVRDTVARPRFTTIILLAFGAAALLLAIIGVYGVLASTVTRRRRELGVRLALGSSRAQVLRQVVLSGLVLAAGGVLAGMALSVGITRTLAAVLHEVSTLDPAIFVLVPLVMTAAALVASLIPALRATRIDPAEALRPE